MGIDCVDIQMRVTDVKGKRKNAKKPVSNPVAKFLNKVNKNSVHKDKIKYDRKDKENYEEDV